MLPALGSYITGLTSGILGTYADFKGVGSLKDPAALLKLKHRLGNPT